MTWEEKVMPYASGNVYSYTPTQVNSPAAWIQTDLCPPAQPSLTVCRRVCVFVQMVGTILTGFGAFVFGVSTLISSSGASSKKASLAAIDAAESAKEA
jgi:hypothetical protein